MLRRVIGEDIELVMSIEPDLGHVLADRAQMEQVLLNLVVNARDAMPAGGALRIELTAPAVGGAHDGQHVTPPGRYVCLTVSDSGSGMDRETASRIFEPFFTTKGVGRGTGLGLAMVYGIVQQAGGTIEEDTEIGHGTTFYVYLPQTAEGAQNASRLRQILSVGRPLHEEDPEPCCSPKTIFSFARSSAPPSERPAIPCSKRPGARRRSKSPAPHPSIWCSPTRHARHGRPRPVGARHVDPLGNPRAVHVGVLRRYVLHHGIQPTSAQFIRKPFSTDALIAKVRDLL